MEKGLTKKVFFFVLIGFFVLVCWLFRPYFSSIILALLIANAFYPVYNKVNRLLKGREKLSSLIMTMAILLILVVPIGIYNRIAAFSGGTTKQHSEKI